MSAISSTAAKNDLSQVVKALEEHAKGDQLTQGKALIESFLADVNADELGVHTPVEWANIVLKLLSFVQERKPGLAKVDLIDQGSGGRDGRSALRIVTDDMPFLVDSVNIMLGRAQLEVRVLQHPIVSVQRDSQGKLKSLARRSGDDKGNDEAVIYCEIRRIGASDKRQQLVDAVRAVLADVRVTVEDWQPMQDKMLAVAEDLSHRTLPLDEEAMHEGQAFLQWATDNHFTFLGYCEYRVIDKGDDKLLVADETTGLGLLRGLDRAGTPRSLKTLVAAQLPQSGAMDAIILTKTNALSDVHRSGYMDYIGVLKFDEKGSPVGEDRFLGLYTSSAYMRRPQDVPLLRRKVQAVMQRSGLKADAYSGKVLRHILDAMPRNDLFQCSEDELFAIATGILDLKERTRPRLFVRRDRYGRFFSCIAFIPRDRYNTRIRQQIEKLLRESFRGERLESEVLMGESALARLHITVRPSAGEHPTYDVDQLEKRLVRLVRNWQDDLRACLAEQLGDIHGAELANRYAAILPIAYTEKVSPEVAASDIATLDALVDQNSVSMKFYRPEDRPEALRFKIYRRGGDIMLSDLLPQLENLGLRVLTEHVYEIEHDSTRMFIQDFEVRPMDELAFSVEDVGKHFELAFEHVWRGDAESDTFNRLVLGALLTWRQVAILRGYCKYLQQVGIPFSQSYMEETLNRYPAIANLLVELFNAKFDPRREDQDKAKLEAHSKQLRAELTTLITDCASEANPGLIDRVVGSLSKPRQDQIDAIWAALRALMDQVASLDDERIVESYMSVIRSTLRTSFFQQREGVSRDYISFKFDSAQVPDAPKPVPYREIFVYSPRMEGVHLRFGAVARGGLRWSDRREDFRTEVLGLVKAQEVKNTVIVPVGSKGGFVLKRAPESEGRDGLQKEGITCYKMFVNGMLDITDNLVDDKVVVPPDLVCYDGEDPYLVVAADKGTARFSDIANGLSADHNYWLDDAFASGGSHGYDHKGMGITARGGWESVKRHFRSLGRDSQSEDFTCVGIGDMSGDVFGNGMLRSEHILLVGAFDHRDIFLDPSPDAARSFAERERMFALPRSSWEDYDASLISEGGGVFSRSAKSIPVSAQVREVLGLKADVEHLTSNEMMSAMLKAPVDLLWNGGIGTYVKSSSETHADVGDRANNGLRIDGREVRCKIIGEGGNLGMTQLGRIEVALNGVTLNTDFIDNSAGVDTSDHEVNIKILLGDAVKRKELSEDDRNSLLAEMTDEVAALVLHDNYQQNQAISMMEHMAVKRLGSMAHFIRTLEGEGRLDRQVEFLPTDNELLERRSQGKGLTRPELAVLLSYDKIKLYEQLLDSDIPEDPYLSRELKRYFPERLHGTYDEHMQRHRLKREIIASAVTNSTVNRMGATFMMRMQEDTGQDPAAIAKAFTAAREIVDARALWADIEALDAKVADATQIDAKLQTWSLLRHLTRWLLNKPGGNLDIAANVERYQPVVTALRDALPEVLTPTGTGDFEGNAEKWEGLGFGETLAQRLARAPVLRASLDMAEVAHKCNQPIERVAGVFFGLAEALDLDWLRNEIESLPVESRWHAQARGSLLDELNQQHRALASQVLVWDKDMSAEKVVAAWLDRDDANLKYTRAMLAEILTQTADYPIASVAVRRLALLANMH